MEINDLIIQDTEWRGGGIVTVVKETDPLLRRFGQCDFIDIEIGTTLEVQRQKADEVWSVLREKATFVMEDTRSDSPSFEARQTVTLWGKTPQTMLIPFGISCRITTEHPAGATLVRLTTHRDETHPGDKVPS